MSDQIPQSRTPVVGDAVERISVSLPADHKQALEKIASKKKVSIAWVIRDAVEKYLESDQSK